MTGTGRRQGGSREEPAADLAERLSPGVVFTRTMRLTDEHAARHLTGRGVKVFSTPEMVRFMERCVVDGLQPYLAPGQNAVGIRVDIKHLAPTPIGMEVTVECRLIDIDRRKLSFAFEVRDDVETIGAGRYDSFIVDQERQQQRLGAKLAGRT